MPSHTVQWILLLALVSAFVQPAQAQSDTTELPLYVVDGSTVPAVAFDREPEFPGGRFEMYDWFAYKVRVGNLAMNEALFGGQIILVFRLDTAGGINDLYIDESSTPMLDDQFLRAAQSMPPWRAAVQNGKKTEVWIFLPLVFRLAQDGLLAFDENPVKTVQGSTKKTWWLKAILVVGALGLFAALFFGLR
jgi:hypothetical protein